MFELQKRDFVTRFKALAQKTLTHKELLTLVMTSYELFVSKVDLRSLADTKRPKDAEEKSIHMPYFNFKTKDWVVYFIITLLSILGKWADK